MRRLDVESLRCIKYSNVSMNLCGFPNIVLVLDFILSKTHAQCAGPSDFLHPLSPVS
jgi:hypothetical protein